VSFLKPSIIAVSPGLVGRRSVREGSVTSILTRLQDLKPAPCFGNAPRMISPKPA
jgi:hypothetical protein